MSETSLMNPDIESDQLAEHKLVPLNVAEKVRAWYLRPAEGGRMMSTLVMETPEGIVICGDLCPRGRGVVSNLGYGAAWFAGQLSPSYLCEKFLDKEWVPEIAADHMLTVLAQAVEDGDLSAEVCAEASAEVRDAREDFAFTPDRAREIFDDAGLTDFTDYNWNVYNPNDARWLIAIQRRFAALYHAEVPNAR